MAMRIETRHEASGDIEIVRGNRVRFVAEDGLTMFEVVAGKDGRSIEVRGVDTCKVGDVVYSNALDIRPHVSNLVEIRAREYDVAA